MAKKSPVYTRTGDQATTSLVGGERIPKYSLLLEAYGSVDELSSFIGLLLADDAVIDENRYNLFKVQNMLFNIGCYLATTSSLRDEKVDGLTKEDIALMEEWIDNIDETLTPIKNFILPGGCNAAAKANVARTVCRRAERRILQVAASEKISSDLLAYINRLSDYLFVLGRQLNKNAGFEEPTWQKP